MSICDSPIIVLGLGVRTVGPSIFTQVDLAVRQSLDRTGLNV